MDKKYEFTGETLEWRGRTLRRIRAVKSFGDIKSIEYVNKGDLGGWIESEDNLSHEGECWVYHEAKVYDRASVRAHAKVAHKAQVFDDAMVFVRAYVIHNAQVFNRARVCDDAAVGNHALVGGEEWVSGYEERYKTHGFFDAPPEMLMEGE